jgi:hypothetical protein
MSRISILALDEFPQHVVQAQDFFVTGGDELKSQTAFGFHGVVLTFNFLCVIRLEVFVLFGRSFG